MTSIVYPALALGLALFVALVVHHGVGEIAAALAVAGWGLAGVTVFHLIPMVADAMGWRSLLCGRARLPVRTIVWARWVGESVNTLLPVMQVGGNVVKARLLVRRGVAGRTAGASVVVDVTLVTFTLLAFAAIGLCLLFFHLGGERVALRAAVGTALMAGLLAALYAAQRRGIFGVLARGLERVARGADWTALTSGAAALDEAVARLYEDRRAVATACAWHFASWVVGAGEVWLALAVLGHPIGFLEAVLVESLGQTVRAAAFVVPGALGVQEGGYLMLGRLLGLTPETSLALALAKRVRELSLGVTGLVAWQLAGATTFARNARVGEAAER